MSSRTMCRSPAIDGSFGVPPPRPQPGWPMPERRSNRLEKLRAPVELKLSTLWAAAMFCYVYGDFFGLFVPGNLARMNAGHMGPMSATLAVLLGGAVMMAVPSLMVFLALVMPPAINRWANIALGLAYTAILLATMPGMPPFYLFLGATEIMLTLAIAAHAWRWPRAAAAG